MLSVKQGSCEYQFQSHWFDPTRNQTQVYSSRDRRSIPLGHLSCQTSSLALHIPVLYKPDHSHIDPTRTRTFHFHSHIITGPPKCSIECKFGQCASSPIFTIPKCASASLFNGRVVRLQCASEQGMYEC